MHGVMGQAQQMHRFMPVLSEWGPCPPVTAPLVPLAHTSRLWHPVGPLERALLIR